MSREIIMSETGAGILDKSIDTIERKNDSFDLPKAETSEPTVGKESDKRNQGPLPSKPIPESLPAQQPQVENTPAKVASPDVTDLPNNQLAEQGKLNVTADYVVGELDQNKVYQSSTASRTYFIDPETNERISDPNKVDPLKNYQIGRDLFKVLTDPDTGEIVARIPIPAKEEVQDVLAGKRKIFEMAGGAQGFAENYGTRLDIEIQTEYGRFPVPWPVTDEGSMALMRNIMTRVEQASEAEGGAGVAQAFRELQLVISSFITETGPGGHRVIGQAMLREMTARIELHKDHLAFSTTAADGDAVHNAIRSIRADQLNYFFGNMEGIWPAFIYFEQHSQEYLRNTANDEELENFRNRVETHVYNSIISRYPTPNSADQYYADITSISARRIAERLWEITARRAQQDQLVDKTYLNPVTYDQAFAIEDLTLMGIARSGNRAFQKLLLFKEWVQTEKRGWNMSSEQIHLLDDVDVGGEGFFDSFPGQIEGDYQRILYENYRANPNVLTNYIGGRSLQRQGSETPTQFTERVAKTKAIEDSLIVTEILTGMLKDKPDKVGVVPKANTFTGRPDYKWHTGKAMDLTNINWDPNGVANIPLTPRAVIVVNHLTSYLGLNQTELNNRFTDIKTALRSNPKIDFRTYGEYPLWSWSFLKIARPDKFRSALTDDSQKSLLRNPTEDNLFSLESTIGVLWKEKRQLLVNMSEFLVNFNHRVLGRRNFTIEEAKVMIEEAAEKKFIKKEEKEAAEKEFTQRYIDGKPWRRISVFMDRLIPKLAGRSLSGFLAELLAQIFKSFKI